MGMDIFGKEPKSDENYFRANVWSWRPIHALCEAVMGRKYPEWSYNDGKGLDTQEECNALANALESHLQTLSGDEITMESDCRIDPETNRFLPRGVTGGVSAYGTDKEHVRRFITFLRACGGFEIW